MRPPLIFTRGDHWKNVTSPEDGTLQDRQGYRQNCKSNLERTDKGGVPQLVFCF